MSKVIGITGGIATGKSMATHYIQKRGYTVLDADEIVHKLQQPGGALYQAIFENFGSIFFDENKRLDREKLGRLVFSNPTIREKLSGIQDIIIRQELIRQRDEQMASLFFMDIPLLFEQHYEDLVDAVWLIDVSETIQLLRLQKRNIFTEEEAKARIETQLSGKEKRRRANVVLDNSGTIEQLYKQIDKELEMIQNGRE